jgi:hypothetical protein
MHIIPTLDPVGFVVGLGGTALLVLAGTLALVVVASVYVVYTAYFGT